jgi:CheY-like chemotaxis protein
MIHVRLNGAPALKLGRVIRQQPQYAHLPIVFYAQKFEETWRSAVMEGVGDDFLSDKTLDAQVLATVLNRIRFARKQKQQ